MHIAVARFFTEQGGGLEVLSFASGLSARSTFPSWVPDWRHEDSGGVPSSSFGTLDVFASQYKVAAATRLIIMPSHSIRKLTLKRLFTDSVERTMDIDSLRIDKPKDICRKLRRVCSICWHPKFISAWRTIAEKYHATLLIGFPSAYTLSQ